MHACTYINQATEIYNISYHMPMIYTLKLCRRRAVVYRCPLYVSMEQSSPIKTSLLSLVLPNCVIKSTVDAFKVNDDFFMQNEDVPETNAQTCKTDVTVAAPFVLDCIDMLSAGAAPGPDGIPAKMIKAAKTSFASMLTNILQSSLDSGDIPGILKLAFVTPIHKGDS